MRRFLVLCCTLVVVGLLAACQPRSEELVDIRLLGPEITSADLAGRDPADVAGLSLADVLLNDEEIVGYDRDEHALLVTAEAWDRLQAMRVPVNGIPFAICLDGEPVYAGCLWTFISSLSYDGVTILLPTVGEDDRLPIELGYPGNAFFSWDDPRDDARMLRALSERHGQ